MDIPMERHHSTGSLSATQKGEQDRNYNQKHQYDYVIVGTGMSALSVGSLLAHSGFKVCMLEAHDIPGGYAHSFEMNDFYFCAQVHYIWGCAPKQPIYEFLKYLGLQDEIKFVPYNPDGYDHMVMPDGKKVKIPYGYAKLTENIEAAYPGQRNNLQRFFGILDQLQKELSLLPASEIPWWKKLTESYKFLTLIKYRNKTLQNVFDECHLSKEAQAVLNANTGDLMCPPNKLSIFAFLGLFGGYNKGAYYPEKHFKFFIDRLAKFITEHKGCHIYYEAEVVEINTSDSKVTGVKTKDGKTFKAANYICNMDPQKASYLIGRDHFPKKDIEALSYKYSPSSLMIYLGVKGIDLRDYGFGNHNIWHLEQWDINKSWDEIKVNNYEKPWMFFSTPTLHTNYGGVAPEGCQILEMGTAANYGYFKKLYDENPHEYRKEKRNLANRLIKIASEKYIPNLEKHIALKVVGSPVTNETFCYAPYGNCYGSDMTPENVGLGRLKSQSPWKNFYWCNASSGFPGIYGTTINGMNLYSQLTGDHFYKYENAPTTEQAIQYATELHKKKKNLQELLETASAGT
jgi:all-trans-retinol 13,14-reductase